MPMSIKKKTLELKIHWFGGDLVAKSCLTVVTPCEVSLKLAKIREAILSSVQFSHSVMSDSLLPHEWQHARPPCPSPTPGVHPNSRPLSR